MHALKKSIGVVAAAMLLASGPVASAQTAAASKLSVAKPAARAATPAENAAQMRGGFIIPAIAVVAIILGILAFSGGDDKPHSP